MAGYQFLHIECYGKEESTKQRTQTKKNADGTFTSKEVEKKKDGSVSSIISEAKRDLESCPHIKNPQPPIVLMGDLDQVEAEALAWADQAKDAQGRKLRKDAHCLLAGVISLPRSNEEDWPKFKAEALEWLKKKYGENLRCVIEHTDESHPHIHFYAVAKNGQSFDDLHEGKRAQKELKKQNPEASKKEQNIAFAEAMRATQDDFSKSVAQRFGLARLGPGRRRLTRSQWQKEQKQAEALRTVEATARRRHEHYKQKAIAEAQPLIEQAIAEARAEAKAEAKKLGEKVGGVVTGLVSRLHKPSKQAKAEAEATKQQAKDYADRIKKQAERAVQDERNSRRSIERELEKQRNIATNTEADNKRLTAQLEATEADRQRLLKQLKAGGGGGGWTKPK